MKDRKEAEESQNSEEDKANERERERERACGCVRERHEWRRVWGFIYNIYLYIFYFTLCGAQSWF